MGLNEDASRIIRERETRRRQETESNFRPTLQQLAAEVRRKKEGVADRLRAAGYPENEFFTTCIYKERQTPVWVVPLDGTEQACWWAGVFPDGGVRYLWGTGVDHSNRRLTVHPKPEGLFPPDLWGVGRLRKISNLLDKCSVPTPRRSWDVDPI